MKTIILISTLLIAAYCTLDASDTLASRFIFKGDTDRRLMIDFTFKTNPGQIFQLAYGLKRQKLYDLMRAYLHPNIVNIALYGSNAFFIIYNREVAFKDGKECYTPSSSRHMLTGYYLTHFLILVNNQRNAHRYFDQDKRSEKTTYINLHSFGWGAKRWRLTPVASAAAGVGFYISLVTDEHKYDGVDQSNWLLSVQRLNAFDRMDKSTTHLIVSAPPIQSNVWTLTPVDRGDSFIITLAYDDNMFDGVSQSGFSLDGLAFNPNEWRTGKAGSTDFDSSIYAVARQSGPGEYKSWSIQFAGN